MALIELRFSDLVIQLREFFNIAILYIVMALIIFDILSGIAKSWVTHEVNSTLSRKGILKHTAIIMFIIISFPILTAIGFKSVATTIVLYLIYSYLISVIENLTVLGVPFPKGILKRLTKLKDLIENKEE
ncbi:phage holin family protein [Gemella bergeri]